LNINLGAILTRAIVSVIVFSKRIIIVRILLGLGFLRKIFRLFFKDFILVFQTSNNS
jgi:hypothetical protein